MPRYKVIAREVLFYEAVIEADDDAAAEEMGNEIESQEFEYLEGDWEVVNIEAIPEPKPDTKKNQLSLF